MEMGDAKVPFGLGSRVTKERFGKSWTPTSFLVGQTQDYVPRFLDVELILHASKHG